MAPSLPPENDDDYDSAADSDFDASPSASSGDESEGSDADSKGIKAAKVVDGDVEMGSGDEGVVAQGRKKRSKRGSKGKGKQAGGSWEAADEDEASQEESAAGIRVRLRSGRGGEEARKKSLPKRSAATANIDEIWARMNNPLIQPTLESEPLLAQASDPISVQSQDKLLQEKNPAFIKPNSLQTPLSTHEPENTITIPHTYTFAGQTHTSTKTVPLSSPAAQAYLASRKATSDAIDSSSTVAAYTSADDTPIAGTEGSATQGPRLRRPLARKNLLQPNPTCFLFSQSKNLPPRADLPLSIGGHLHHQPQASDESTGDLALSAHDKESAPPSSASIAVTGTGKVKLDKGEKLNTVEKSKLDWEAEVERLGLREELEKAEKSGGSYLGRKEFLDRVEAARDEASRRARLGLSQ